MPPICNQPRTENKKFKQINNKIIIAQYKTVLKNIIVMERSLITRYQSDARDATIALDQFCNKKKKTSEIKSLKQHSKSKTKSGREPKAYSKARNQVSKRLE